MTQERIAADSVSLRATAALTVATLVASAFVFALIGIGYCQSGAAPGSLRDESCDALDGSEGFLLLGPALAVLALGLVGVRRRVMYIVLGALAIAGLTAVIVVVSASQS